MSCMGEYALALWIVETVWELMVSGTAATATGEPAIIMAGTHNKTARNVFTPCLNQSTWFEITLFGLVFFQAIGCFPVSVSLVRFAWRAFEGQELPLQCVERRLLYPVPIYGRQPC